MSDFFGDDFTAELRGYFLDTLSKEADRFVDLIDDHKWMKLVEELNEQVTAWIVDAKTNEFEFLAQWLLEFQEKSVLFKNPGELESAIKILKNYLEALGIDKKDNPEFLQKFSIESKVVGQSQFLHCRLNGMNFVISVGWVMEVVDKLPIYPLPTHHAGLSGMISFRGEAIPVIDLTDYGFTRVSDEKFNFVICNIEGAKLALQVSEADQLLTLENSEMQPIEATQLMVAAPFIKKFFIRESKSVMVLDLDTMVA